MFHFSYDETVIEQEKMSTANWSIVIGIQFDEFSFVNECFVVQISLQKLFFIITVSFVNYNKNLTVNPCKFSLIVLMVL